MIRVLVGVHLWPFRQWVLVACGAEACLTTLHGFRPFFEFTNGRGADWSKNELSDSLSVCDIVGLEAAVEEENHDFPGVGRVDDARRIGNKHSLQGHAAAAATGDEVTGRGSHHQPGRDGGHALLMQGFMQRFAAFTEQVGADVEADIALVHLAWQRGGRMEAKYLEPRQVWFGHD